MLNEDEGMSRFFDTGAPIMAADGVTQTMAISTFGGATAANFSASLKVTLTILAELIDLLSI